MVESALPQVLFVWAGFLANRVGMGYAGAMPYSCSCIPLYTRITTKALRFCCRLWFRSSIGLGQQA